jgi:CHAT domain-containing protein
VAARDLALAEEGRRAHELLLEPAREALRGRTQLGVIPDGPLWEVPFQALVDARGRYVIDSAAVSYAPSLALLKESMRPRPRAMGGRTLLAMGKADFGTKADLPAVPLMSDLGPLPDAESQVRRIGEIYGADRSAVFIGSEATEGRFKAEAPHRRIIHLASHGLFEESSPLYSSVVLSRGGSPSSEDGLLEAWELLELKLDADLVILSACETGRGRIASGEGIVGTMWALFAAGAGATIVSQWKVESSSTTELMTALHRGIAGGGGGTANHLRNAALVVKETPKYAHPFYWAPFVLVGNPN